MMMALGLFVFSLRTASYQELQRVTNWRHPSNSRVGTPLLINLLVKVKMSLHLKA
jgi:phage protein U